jgi:hypothetical protein
VPSATLTQTGRRHLGLTAGEHNCGSPPNPPRFPPGTGCRCYRDDALAPAPVDMNGPAPLAGRPAEEGAG